MGGWNAVPYLSQVGGEGLAGATQSQKSRPRGWVGGEGDMESLGIPAPRTEASMAADQGWIKDAEQHPMKDTKSGVRWARMFLAPAVRKALQQHGGPQQLLLQRLNSREARTEYAKFLWEEFPPLETNMLALVWTQLPPQEPGQQDQAPAIVHAAALGYTQSCSLKGAPSLKVSLQLLEEIITDGFVSAGEPLLLTELHGEWDPVVSPWKKDHPENTIEAFSLGFVKGAARICTLHAILVVALDDKVNLKQDPGQGGAERGGGSHPDQRSGWWGPAKGG